MESLTALGSVVGNLLKERRQTLAIAESSAGGLINAALVAVPGASAYYIGGGVIYTGAGRSALLGLSAQDMANIRSSTEAFAKLLARRVRSNLGATWGLSETGASGPSGNRYGDAPGHACIAVYGPVEAVITVGEDGRFYASVPLFAGKHVYDVADEVCAALQGQGALLGRGTLVHSYPHSWRAKTPLIFRTTPQPTGGNSEM